LAVFSLEEVRVRKVLIALAAVAVGLCSIAVAPTAIATEASSECATFEGASASLTSNTPGVFDDDFSSPFALNAGEIITASIAVLSGSGSAAMTVDSVPHVTMTSLGESTTWTVPSNGSYTLGFILNLLQGGEIQLVYSCSAPAAAPILMWQQAIGRESATAPCPDGYTGSWDTWPNGGKGGFVCNRFVPVYGS